MTALVFENLSALRALTQGLRTLLTRLSRRLDSQVSALAARSVPEWRMQEVEREINRYRACAGRSRRTTRT